MDIITISKFYNLSHIQYHPLLGRTQKSDENKIYWVKNEYDQIQMLFREIRETKRKVIIISGGSDNCVTETWLDNMPNNVHKWFCQNKQCDNKILQPIPIGVEDHESWIREGLNYSNGGFSGGAGDLPEDQYPHFFKSKGKTYETPPTKKANKLVYANFPRNYAHRVHLWDKIKNLEYITKAEMKQNFLQWIDELLDHECVLCPTGNGMGDNRRIYDTLYLNRVPLTFNRIQHSYFFKNFGVPLITEEDLLNKDKIKNIVDETKGKINREYIDFSYWKDMILEEAKKIK